MNIVTEKRLAEVQAQYEHVRASWIDPTQHEAIKKQLSMEQHTKQTYEVSRRPFGKMFTGMFTKLLSVQKEIYIKKT